MWTEGLAEQAGAGGTGRLLCPCSPWRRISELTEAKFSPQGTMKRGRRGRPPDRCAARVIDKGPCAEHTENRQKSKKRVTKAGPKERNSKCQDKTLNYDTN